MLSGFLAKPWPDAEFDLFKGLKIPKFHISLGNVYLWCALFQGNSSSFPKNTVHGYSMSHLYDSIEPNAVSEALLRKCVTEQGPQGELGKVANAEGIDFNEVEYMRLDFKSKQPLYSR